MGQLQNGADTLTFNGLAHQNLPLATEGESHILSLNMKNSLHSICTDKIGAEYYSKFKQLS